MILKILQSMDSHWIGQAVGILAMIESFFIFQVTDRRKMVLLKLVDDVLWIIHFVLIGGYTGALTTTVAIFREIIFFFRGEKKWASSPLWAVGFSIVFAACAPLSWTGIFSIFPATASVISTWVFWMKRTETAKLLQVPSAVCTLVYTVVYSSYSGMLAQIIMLVSIGLFFGRKALQKRNRTSKIGQ